MLNYHTCVFFFGLVAQSQMTRNMDSVVAS